ncbi:MAG: branched-chain amino acid ABC transporter substrate-binding protein [Limnochordia bacterium]
MRKCGVVVMVFLLGLLTITGAAAPKPIRIGLQGPITGAWAYEGEMAVNSVQIVADQINGAGGVLGRPIEIVVGDDQGSPRQGALVAQRMVSDGVVAVISSYGSSVTEPSAAIYEEAELLSIGYGATAERLTERGLKFFFRTCFRDDRQGQFFAALVDDVLKVKRVAIIHDNTTFARGLAEAAKRFLEKSPAAELVFYDAVTPGEKDFSPILTRMRTAAPEVVYFTGYYPEAGLILYQARNLGIDALFVGGNAAINDEFVTIAGLDVALGSIVTQEPLPTDLPFPEARDFLAEYIKRHGEAPSTPWPVYAADALKVITAAIEATGSTDPRVLTKYLREGLKDLPGITGPISFEASGDRAGAIYRAYVVDHQGQLVPY